MFDRNKGFYDFSQYVDESYLDLTSNTGEYDIKYPISFLQDTLGGMTKSELLVIGADAGIGKTEIVNKIAFYNAMLKKNVYLFSLEGDKYDLINRCRYKYYLKKLQESKNWGLYCSYREFLINRIPGLDFLEEIDNHIKETLGTIKVYSREDDLTLERFEAHLDMINDVADLVVIDHLHYFDFVKKEYEAINEIMKKIKKLQDKYRVPMILVSHLRKKDKMRTFPNQEDFHGSSNIVKQSDTCIVLGHIDTDEEDATTQVSTGMYKTGMRIVKSRTGFPSKLVGIMEYDLETRKYMDKYDLVVCGSHYLKKLEGEDLPKWAKNAKR